MTVNRLLAGLSGYHGSIPIKGKKLPSALTNPISYMRQFSLLFGVYGGYSGWGVNLILNLAPRVRIQGGVPLLPS